jgi:RNA polymerase sigma-70 factor (ECF subfamily)
LDGTSIIQSNEESLVKGLKNRDSSAINILYERYSAALYGVISRIINDDHLAEDVLQESFVKIWKNVDEYDLNRGRLFTWMLNICRNSAIDKMRSKGYKTAMKTQSDETVLYENPTKIYDSVKPETIGIREIVTKFCTIFL